MSRTASGDCQVARGCRTISASGCTAQVYTDRGGTQGVGVVRNRASLRQRALPAEAMMYYVVAVGA